ncbi:methyltransferase-like protein 22 isoform X2 [Dendronephthya gigantea]|uniref:methyltransferase-like protein 22 isoform X2 n=1 Tax=Dendronephthya gigantea TaxID=151771 RepID=UPI0010698D77|nr:methyltransferase-like protein 22 isoform X2 [Dendronephthya gigantea]XP_028416594.1 methyltransferase-like protein 22 isoform X2 [Dendronephthya gigantea]
MSHSHTSINLALKDENDLDNDCIEDVVLSEVHVYKTFTPIEEGNYALSRFHFTTPHGSPLCNAQKPYTSDKQILKHKENEGLVNYDEDGDMIIPRFENDVERNIITIEHTLATPIKSVGTQVWQGSMLLCDFLIHNEKEFDGCIALELGGGVGLCSIVMARVAKRVFCTDIRDSLDVCESNKLRNHDIFKYATTDNEVMVIRELDFFHSSRILDDMDHDHKWTKEDKNDLKRLSVIMASDVIYDDALTDAFLDTVDKLLVLNPHSAMYISLEKRINFTLEALEIVSPAYDYFMNKLEVLTKKNPPSIKIEKLETNFPQYFKYERVKELELWKVYR